ncbi:hypothetical protein [Magnetospirillum sulfuroxidans]|uniref:Uncharacterized protein n=1 Tax=Magnetospirillum sulfuroxidans TaxID=611300 RepID=A0ABS5I9S3_9PROT|nr:hypothetical protein [Magnetospirillum sulfuroxidans]MBR9971174.1 hypothetical protein [Magnetospirillum sulfuroxidans]
MTTIASTSSSVAATLAARPPLDSETSAKPVVTAAPTDAAQQATTVTLSDRAKAILAKAQKDQAVADQLEEFLRGLAKSRDPAAKKTSGGGGANPQASEGISKEMAAVKEWAKSDVFRNAAQGNADDTVRALVRDGRLPKLPQLEPGQMEQLSEAEKNIYGTVRALQGLYDAMPKSLSQALSDHVTSILDTYPDNIARMKDGLASGSLPAEDGWDAIIARDESILAAAQQGKMRIHAVDAPALVQSKWEFSVTADHDGWSASGTSVTADFPALYAAFNTKNVEPGTSPYIGDYVFTW